MSRSRNDWHPPSLAQHFDAPDGYTGEFGWLCGFSADASFMNDAAERFTRLTHGQRAQQGKLRLALYLDPSNPQIGPVDAPGVVHLPIRQLSERPFRLLHAKVAILGFRSRNDHKQWSVRLIVSTGNWTRQTLEESLDVAWRLDVTSEALREAEGVGQACADIQAAWELLAWIDTKFDSRLLKFGQGAESDSAPDSVLRWIRYCIRRADGVPRVFDNRRKSVFEEIKSRLLAADRVVARNYLAMGSGFFEAAASGEAEIPRRIVNDLIGLSLLTKTSEVDLFVNPIACQSIAISAKALMSQRPEIVVRPPAAPEAVFSDRRNRGLHAKFLFSANSRGESNRCGSPWVYLGSGNLTDAGLLKAANKFNGNLEAGVVLFPDGTQWRASRSVDADCVLGHLLPIQRDNKCTPEQLETGSEWCPAEATFVAPPISHVEWHEREVGGELRAAVDNAAVEVLSPSGEPCQRLGAGFLWPDSMPRSVRFAWLAEGKRLLAEVPVIDQYGRIAATPLPAIGLEEAWWQLADFPLPPEGEGSDEGVEHDSALEANQPVKGRGQAIATPIRQMMELIENIAARQTEVSIRDWPLWCNRLEQTLGQAKDSPPVKAFIELQLNPLGPLYTPPFRPAFAETNSSDAGKLYEHTLGRIEAAWQVAGLTRLGDKP